MRITLKALTTGAPAAAGASWAGVNLERVDRARTGTVARRLLAAIFALAALALAATTARAAGPVHPPTTARLDRATARVMAQPRFRADPRAVLRGTGGAAAGSPSGRSNPLFPKQRMLALYGAPQLKSTALGNHTPTGAAKLLRKQVTPYEKLGDRPVIPSFDLIGVVANSTPGPDRLYRTRQPDALIAKYLKRVRASGGRLMLDIQPGRSPILDEVDAMSDWIAEPDVDVAIDPEWNVGPKGVPGETPGSVTARELNVASRRIQRIAEENALPPKVLVVHQFSTRSIRQRTAVKQRPEVQVTFNFDGIGKASAKIAGYENLITEGIFNGFSLFYDLDTPLMKPRRVLGLDPEPDFLLYQ